MKTSSKIAKFAQRDGLVPSFLKFTYQLLVHSVFQMFINAMATIIAGVYFCTNGKINALFVVFFTTIYLTILWLFYCVNNYRKEKIIKVNIFEKCLKENATLVFRLKEYLLELINKAKEKKSKGEILDEDIFKNMSNYVCDSIYTLLCDYTNCNSFKISVFQQFEEGDEKYSRMVAYKHRKNDVPSTYRNKFSLFKYDKNSIKPQHTIIFENCNEKITVLDNKELVKSKFVKFDNNELETHQYVGIPGIVNVPNVGFVLQVCTLDKNLLGSEDEILEFCNNFLLPYRELLKLVYEIVRSFNTLNDLKSSYIINSIYDFARQEV